MRRARPLFRAIAVSAEPVDTISRETVCTRVRRFIAKDGFALTVPEHVIERACALGKKAMPNEMFALLVGRRCADASGEHVAVLDVVQDEQAQGGPTSVTTTLASEAATRALAHRMFPDGIVLGWLHTHPEMSTAFSARDRANQRTWGKPYHLGIVVEPTTGAMSVYRGPESELLLEDEPETPTTPHPSRPRVQASAPNPTSTKPERDREPYACDGWITIAALAGVLLAMSVATVPGFLALRELARMRNDVRLAADAASACRPSRVEHDVIVTVAGPVAPSPATRSESSAKTDSPIAGDGEVLMCVREP